MKKLLVATVALILYGSFFPWKFFPHPLPANPLWILLHSFPSSADRYVYRDGVINVTLYIPFGALCLLSLSEGWSRLVRVSFTLVAGALLSASVEMLQLYTPGRECSLLDLMCNTAGTGIGILLASSFSTLIYSTVRDSESTGVFRVSPVLALLYLWSGYLLFPFFPVLSRSMLHSKLSQFLSAGWTWEVFFENGAGWLAAAALLQTLAGRARLATLLAIALLLIPLKLVIVDRTMSQPELAGALAGAGMWFLLRNLSRPKRIAGCVALVALAIAGLSPFHFTSAEARFVSIPFLPLLQAPWESALVILMRKSFLYGSAIWLLHEEKGRWISSTVAVAAVLAGIEALQVFLPGRTPELTDPVLAILLAYGLMHLERRRPAAEVKLKA